MTQSANPAQKLAAEPTAPTAAGFRTHTARVLAALARRIDRAAERRARRKAARLTMAELSRLPETVRMELGVNLPGAHPGQAGSPSAFLQGLAGPAVYWGPQPAGPRRGGAKR